MTNTLIELVQTYPIGCVWFLIAVNIVLWSIPVRGLVKIYRQR